MKNKILYQVDSFTDTPFKGNPAGVMILEDTAEDDFMQKIATEMNLSETAFIIPDKDHYQIRFFTPVKEVPLCGHATLASGHIMYELGLRQPTEKISLQAKDDLLTIQKDENWIVMTFPKYPLKKIEIPENFKETIGFTPIETYESKYGWILALADDEKTIQSLHPKFEQMVPQGLEHVMVTAKSTILHTDFVVRCFVPGMGINEDPVTGSAHCALTPYWNIKTGKSEFNSLQISERTGRLKVSLKDDNVIIKGNATTIFKIEIVI